MVVCEDGDLKRSLGVERTGLSLVSCRASCNCGGGGTGEIDTAVIEAEWA